MTNIYEVNQIFEGNYPAEAAVFCNKHNLRIVQIETLDQAKRFQMFVLFCDKMNPGKILYVIYQMMKNQYI